VDDPAARRVGLSCGGRVRLIVGPAAELPPQLWARLMAREPACLVTAVRGDAVGATRLLTEETVAASGAQVARLFAARVSRTAVAGDAVVTALWPVPTLVIVGAGSIADALVANATLLDWLPVVVDGGLESAAAISQLSRADAVVVLSHARHVDGPALLAALEAEPGYIGALGSRQTQEARSRWLTDRAGDRGISPDLAVIHGPAGLDVGANTPAEIAVAILAEILAVRSGATATPLGEREGPIHRATLS
jgi:xanthine dehydrogenase accessory factor